MVVECEVDGAVEVPSGLVKSFGVEGAQAAQLILMHYGIADVRIQPVSGKLTDNYNPKTKVISLSEGVYNSRSVAAVGIACHEAGHAAQHAEDYTPNKIRSALVPVTNFGSRFGIILAFAGMLLAAFVSLEVLGEAMIYIGLGLYALVALFQLVTLPVEFNASGRAVRSLAQGGILSAEEQAGVRKVLTAAALTYVAAVASSLLTLMRLLLIRGRRR